MSTVSLVKPTIGTVRVSVYGKAVADLHRVHNVAQASFASIGHPDARRAITGVELAQGPRSAVYTVTGYPA